MSDSRRLVQVVSVSLLMLAGCKSMVAPRTGPPELNTFVPSSLRAICDSSNGNPDKDAPFICVDDVNIPMKVKIKDLEVHDTVGPDKEHPVMIKWFTRSGFKDLKIVFPNAPGCPQQSDVACVSGRGKCRVFTQKVSTTTRCEYKAYIEGVEIDPVIIVQPCCTYMEGYAPVAVSP